MCEYRLPKANITPLGISLAPLAQISIYILSPHSPSPRRRSPFPTKLADFRHAGEGRVGTTFNFQFSTFILLPKGTYFSHFATEVGECVGLPQQVRAARRRVLFSAEVGEGLQFDTAGDSDRKARTFPFCISDGGECVGLPPQF